MKEFATPALSSDGVRVLTRAKEGDFQETMMDITAYELQAGESRSFCTDTQETAVLLVEGAVAFSWDGREEEASRNSCIADGADVYKRQVWTAARLSAASLLTL